MIINWNKSLRFRALELEWVLEKRVGTRKKRHGKGREPLWKGVCYCSDPVEALDYLVLHDIRAISGEYPASVFEPILKGMNRIEKQIRGIKEQFKGLLKSVPGGAKAWSSQNMHHPTAANNNAVAQKKRKG